MTTSLMPVGLDKNLTAEELRDLMTYLLTEKAITNNDATKSQPKESK